MKFKYTWTERVIMAIITGGSNFSIIPSLLLALVFNNQFEFYSALFTLVTSFMYHICDSLECAIVMKSRKWHFLDQFGSMMCFNSLLISLTSMSKNERRLKLNCISLFVTITFLIENPWKFRSTVIPHGLFVLIVLYDWIRNGIPAFNSRILVKGSVGLVLSLSMFVKGLDDHSDYLRIYHSLWHVLIGVSSFYLSQIQEKKFISFSEVFALVI